MTNSGEVAARLVDDNDQQVNNDNSNIERIARSMFVGIRETKGAA